MASKTKMETQEAPKEGVTDFRLSDKDREVLKVFFEKADKSEVKFFLEILSMQVRALEGKPVDPEDVYTRLTNVKEILERSRFPTYPLLAKQVYLRLVAWKYPDFAQVCNEWANLEAKSLISYKGLSRTEYTEQMKHAGGVSPAGAFFFGDRLRDQEPKRRGFLRRSGPKTEESEFMYE